MIAVDWPVISDADQPRTGRSRGRRLIPGSARTRYEAEYAAGACRPTPPGRAWMTLCCAAALSAVPFRRHARLGAPYAALCAVRMGKERRGRAGWSDHERERDAACRARCGAERGRLAPASADRPRTDGSLPAVLPRTPTHPQAPRARPSRPAARPLL